MTNSNSKGDRRERELVNWLDENGWAVMRAPASGSATTRELPDVLFGNGNVFYAGEVKASGGDPIYLDQDEVTDLTFFASSFGAKPRIIVKFDLEHGDPGHGEDRPGFYVLDPRDCHRTPADNYRVRKTEAHKHGLREVDL